MWKGAISFSLVHIPVSLHAATRTQSLDLDMLDSRDFSPVGFRRYNKKTGKEVAWKDIVKAFKHGKSGYVVLTDEDFRRANVKASQTIEIQEFVDAKSVPPYFFETPYFVVPEAKAGKVYRLLHDVLDKTGRIAIATVVIRTRQHVVALLPVGDLIVMNTLRYASELLPAIDSEGLDAAKPTTKEVQMAERLVEGMTETWKPAKYHDTYNDDLKKRIAEKIRAKQTKQLTAPDPKRATDEGADSGKVTDLMALLEQSLGSRKADKTGNTAAAAAPRRSSTSRKTTRAVPGRRRRAA